MNTIIDPARVTQLRALRALRAAETALRSAVAAVERAAEANADAPVVRGRILVAAARAALALGDVRTVGGRR